MTKAELVEIVASETELSRRYASEIVETVLEQITQALKKGDRVALIPFGSFIVRTRTAREGRNPKTGERIKIAARKVPAFVAGKSLKDAINKNSTSSKKKATK